jgi:hypothetical protein
MDIVYSVNNIPIRMTTERWFHIVENHEDIASYYDEVLGTVEDPDIIIHGYKGLLIAHRGMGRNRYLAVVYKEISKEDGFVITAYFTSKINRRNIVWKK